MRITISRTVLYLTLLLLSNEVLSQSNELINQGSKLHRDYKFSEAIDIYQKAIDNTNDSLTKIILEERIIQCENGINLLLYATSPNVVSHSVFPTENFYLHISSLPNKSWIKTPNVMVSTDTHPYYNSVFFPSTSKTVYYSAPDNSGSWNIYQITQLSDSLWAQPKIAGENITSSGDEIFPMLSSDGKELYFASNGHYGMGGYDLYVSRWDEESQEWGIPENLGFPFSSTEDDIFFMNSPDGQYSILGTTRGCANSEQISIYALEYTPTPIKKELTDIKEIQQIAMFTSPVDGKNVSTGVTSNSSTMVEDEGMSEYARLVQNMRLLSKELDSNIAEQNENRQLYDSIENEDDKEFIKGIITELESSAIEIRKRLDEATAKVQKSEMEFLTKGIIPKMDSFKEPSSEKMVDEVTLPPYNFSNFSYSDPIDILIEVPEVKFDYSFKILEEAQFAEDNTLPEGLVYQIQLMVVSNKASKKSLKGLSPIYEHKQPTGKYLYAVGLWRTHDEALSCLNQVRKKGFPKAYIISYLNKKPISVKNARIQEKKQKESINEQSYQLVLNGFSDSIPSGIVTAIRDSSNKDIAKSTENGQTLYIVGPFSKKDDALKLKTLLEGLGVENIKLDIIK